MLKQQKKKHPLKWVYDSNKKYLWLVVVLAFFAGAVSGSFILLALVSRQIIDIVTGAGSGSLRLCCLALIGIIGLQAVFNILNANLQIRVVTKLEMNLRQNLFQLLLKKQYAQVKQIHSGEILNRFTSDIDIIVSGMVSLIPQLISILTKLIGGLAILFMMDWQFTLVILFVGIFVVLSSRIYSRKFKYLHKEVQSTNGKVRSFLQECVENIIVIKSFVNEKPIMEQLNTYQEKNYAIRKKRTAVSNIANTAVYVLFSGGYYTALVWGALRIADSQMTFGTLTAFLQIINQIKAPFRSMSGLIPQYYSMAASVERLMEFEELEEEPIHQMLTDVPAFYEKMKAIQLEHADFVYEDGEIVLKGANLRIEKGDFVAIVGLSGAGKSTLFKLLLSLEGLKSGELYFETTQGQILIDAGMRPLFSYVPQGNLILSGTIRENIAFGESDVSQKEIEQAAEIACILEEIKTFPEGFESRIGERGMGLSEGQAQRIAIARAVLSKAPILLLDECTSALDSETEERLLQNLRNLKGKTILCVSHKDATIQSCNKIIRLKDAKFYLSR